MNTRPGRLVSALRSPDEILSPGGALDTCCGDSTPGDEETNRHRDRRSGFYLRIGVVMAAWLFESQDAYGLPPLLADGFTQLGSVGLDDGLPLLRLRQLRSSRRVLGRAGTDFVLYCRSRDLAQLGQLRDQHSDRFRISFTHELAAAVSRPGPSIRESWSRARSSAR
jgi:hypothetical protein